MMIKYDSSNLNSNQLMEVLKNYVENLETENEILRQQLNIIEEENKEKKESR